MFERIINFVVYGDTDKENFEAIKPRMHQYNRMMALVFASVAVVLISAMFVLSTLQEGFVSSRPVYLGGIAFSFSLLVIALAAKRYPVLSYVAMYMAISGFLLYGIAIATLTRPEEQTVTFMVLMIFVPLIFVDKPIRVAAVLIIFIVLFMVMALHTKTGPILSADLSDALIFGILSLVSETVTNRSKIRGYVLERQLHILSETDQLTGLNNRNCYEERFPDYPTVCRRSLCCVYVDANGLHELNNSKGHKAGDEMLCFVAHTIQELFGKEHSYRVGGDEFVAFALDVDEVEVQSRIETLEHRIIQQGYHVAVGYEYSEGKPSRIDDVISSAEQKMYAAKANYYQRSDHDRRRR